LHSQPSSSLSHFPDTLQDLPGIRLDGGASGSAFVAAQGAQVLSWQAADGTVLPSTFHGFRAAAPQYR